jgi:Enoyl-(Acyl carrier protein) reductase
VNCASAGLTHTTMADWFRHEEEALTRWAGSIPARRTGTAGQAAGVVSFRAPASGSHQQDTVLMVDGGAMI